MSFSEKGSTEEAEALVDSLTMKNASLNERNLSGLTKRDFRTLTELSKELTLNADMETEEQELVVESQEVIEHEEEVETEEVNTEEMEVETDGRVNSPDEILPDIKTTKATSVPPLRPLTIAPKPAKVPLAVKPLGGQQLLLLQGGSGGQAIKLVSPQGQELNLANFQISRSLTLKPTIKTLSQGGNISIVQQKPVVMKKILAPGQKTVSKPLTTFAKQGQHFMVVQKADQQQVKIVQAQGGAVSMPSPTKTITLQQAQEMGLLSNAKILPQGQSSNKQTVLLSKNPQKTIKLVPQVTQTQLVTSLANTKTVSLNTIKSPAKILPAAGAGMSKGPQRIIFKTTGSGQAILPSGQLIQVSGSQALNTNQLHQINIPGKGMQYIKFVTTNNVDTSSSPSSLGSAKSSTSTANIVLSEIKPISGISKIAPKPLKTTISTNKINVSGGQVVVMPTSYSIPAHQPQVSKVAISPSTIRHAPVLKPPAVSSDASSPMTPKDEVDANGMRPRKPCNCTKSQCLKLYCDCFANGEFCYMCNCMNCFNNLDNEDHRNRAIKACLERNPNAFRPKIGKAKDISGDLSIRKHTKGCNCKRSGCLKNYCECYEAKIACSNNCKCVGCRNIEDSIEKKSLRMTSIEKISKAPVLSDGKIMVNKEFAQIRPRRTSNTRKQTINYITDDVIEATCQCMLTISDNADENMQDEEMTKRLIIEEFGRCLTEIIECSLNRNIS